MAKKAQRDGKGIWIPLEILQSPILTDPEKWLLAQIDWLDKGKGCFANNEYFAEFFGRSRRQISRLIKSLCTKGLIKSEIDQKAGNNRTLRSVWTRMSIGVASRMSIGVGTRMSIGVNTSDVRVASSKVMGMDTDVRSLNKEDNKVESKEDNNDSPVQSLSEPEVQSHSAQLLHRYGVKSAVAQAIVYEQHTPLSSIKEAIKNGLAKQAESGGLWKLKPGYIIAAINGSRAEGKTVKSTKASRLLAAKTRKPTRHSPLSATEFGRRRSNLLKALRS